MIRALPLLLALASAPAHAACDIGGLYTYRAEVVSIYDADTLRADIDLGFDTWRHNEPLRLKGINAPEVRGVERVRGLVARDALRAILAVGSQVTIQTDKDRRGKYGRYVVTLWHVIDKHCANLNDWLVNNGYAVYRDY